MFEVGGWTSSGEKVSASPKSGAWKGLVAGVGEAAAGQRGCPSGAENSEEESMGGLSFVTGPPSGVLGVP